MNFCVLGEVVFSYSPSKTELLKSPIDKKNETAALPFKSKEAMSFRLSLEEGAGSGSHVRSLLREGVAKRRSGKKTLEKRPFPARRRRISAAHKGQRLSGP